MKILRFNKFTNTLELAESFIENINLSNESIEYKSGLRNLLSNLKIGVDLSMFDISIDTFCNTTKELLQNTTLNVELNDNNILMVTFSTMLISILDDLSVEEKSKIEMDCKSLLEELKMSGIGNGIVKKLVACFKSIKNIYSIITKNKDVKILDMYNDGQINKIVNSTNLMINKYGLNIDTLSSNFSSLEVGVSSLVSKKGLNFVMKKMDVDISKINQTPSIVDTEYQSNGEKLISESD